MNTDLQLSVVIVTQEREAALLQCLEHLANQTVLNFEAIVIDSSKNKTEFANNVANTYPWLRYYYSKYIKQNMQRSRNMGISLAHAPIVAFIDDDCFVR